MSDSRHTDPSRGTPADILVVENDQRIADLLAWFLRRRGHRVRRAASFAEARALLRRVRPDLMLSDVELGPGESARTELPRLSEEGLLPPTLVVSGYLDEQLTHELCSVPAVLGTLAKPFEFRELETRIGALLDHLRGRGGSRPPADPAAEERPEEGSTPRGAASAGRPATRGGGVFGGRA